MTKKQVSPSKRLALILDAGNSDLKAALLDSHAEVSRVLVRHWFADPKTLDAKGVNALTARAGNDVYRYDALAFNYPSGRQWQYHVIGLGASTFDRATKQGAEKYEVTYYPPLVGRVVAELLQLQDSPDKKLVERVANEGIDLYCAHAPIDYGVASTMREWLKGDWRFNSNGVEFVVRVNNVYLWDELFGGYNASNTIITETVNGVSISQRYVDDVIVVDWGGGNVSFMPVLVETREYKGKRVNLPVPQVSAAQSITMGIVDALENLWRLLKEDEAPNRNTHQVFRTERAPNTRTLLEIMRSGTVTIKGKVHNANDLVTQATAPIVNAAVELYQRRFRSTQAGILLNTGGGSAVLADRFARAIDWQGATTYALYRQMGNTSEPDLDNMVWANLEGPLRLLKAQYLRSKEGI